MREEEKPNEIWIDYGAVAGNRWAKEHPAATEEEMLAECEVRQGRMARDKIPLPLQEAWIQGFCLGVHDYEEE